MRKTFRLSLLCALFPFALNLMLYFLVSWYKDHTVFVVRCYIVTFAAYVISLCLSVVFLTIDAYKSFRSRALSRWVVTLRTLAIVVLLLTYLPVCLITHFAYLRLTRLPSDDLAGAIGRWDYRHSEAVHFLNSDPNSISARDESGQTALHLAARSGRDKLVELLVSRGADVSSRDDYGQTPLYSATGSHNDHVDIARLLILHGADINATDKEGNTPLHYPAKWAVKSIIELLILHGATVNIKNNEGKTPLDFAVEQLSVQTEFKDRWRECIRLLRQTNDIEPGMLDDSQ